MDSLPISLIAAVARELLEGPGGSDGYGGLADLLAAGGAGVGFTSRGTSPNEIAALTPLLERLGLNTTIYGAKQLVHKLTDAVAGLLEPSFIRGPDGVVQLISNFVNVLLGSPLDLGNIVDALSSILVNQVPCLLDTVLPKP